MSQTEIQILLILSSAEEAASLSHALSGAKEGRMQTVESVTDIRAASNLLEHAKYDVCVLEAALSGPENADFLLKLAESEISIPVILICRGDNGDIPDSLAGRAGAVISREKLTPDLLEVTIRYVLKLSWNEKLRKEAEEGFRREHERNKDLLAAVSSILIGVRSDGIVTHWNSMAEKTFGVKSGAVLNQPFDACKIEWDFERLKEGIDKCLKNHKQVKIDDLWYSRGGDEMGLLGFSINPLYSSSEGLGEVILLGADITEKRKAAEKLRTHARSLELANVRINKEKAKGEAILESLGEGLVAADEKGRIILANKQAEAMFEKPAFEMLGRHITEVIPIQDERGHKVADKASPPVVALKTGLKASMRACYVRKDKALTPLHISVSPVFLENKIIGVIGVFRDITQEKELDRAKTEFISTVSHELRTPLTSIREGVAQVYEEILGPVNGDQKEFLEIALDEVDRLAAIINDLLDISKIEAGKVTLRKTWIDLTELIRSVLFSYRNVMRNKNLVLEARLPDHAVEIFCDPDKIKQVLTNLLTNAHKFTEAGGKIVLNIKEKDDEIVLSVKDTGCGIAKEYIPKLFDKFVQVGRTAGPGIKGTGLGLAISKNLVEMHEGQIWLESEINKGSVFYFTLPKLKKDSAAKENIEHGLQNLGEAHLLSILVFKTHGKAEPSGVTPAAEVLKKFIKELEKKSARGSADAFLNGSDECIIVLPYAGKKKAADSAEEFKKMLNGLMDQYESHFKISTGISTYPEDADTSELLLRKARVRMTALDELERRSTIRKNFEKSLTLKGEKGKTFEAHSVDISEGGLRLSGTCPFEAGTMTELWLELPRKYGIIHSKAVVVWQRKNPGGTFMLGLKFVGISEAARRKIRNFIEMENTVQDPKNSGNEYRKSA